MNMSTVAKITNNLKKKRDIIRKINRIVEFADVRKKFELENCYERASQQ